MRLTISVILLATIAMAQYVPTQKVTRELSGESVTKLIASMPDNGTITLSPRQLRKAAASLDLYNAIMPNMTNAIADSRVHIAELTNVTDVAVANLYANQLTKAISALPLTNNIPDTIEYRIGSGIRADLAAAAETVADETAEPELPPEPTPARQIDEHVHIRRR